jgi:chromosome segregation ATPase
MSDENLRDQINKIAVEIEKIEQTAKQKESYITSRIEEEFGGKIREIEAKLQHQKGILDQLNKNIEELTSKKNELAPVVKKLEKEYGNLLKEKEKSLNDKLKAIVKEKQTKTKIIDREIKTLEKELKSGKEK